MNAYRIVSMALGLLLVTTGILKYHELFTVGLAPGRPPWVAAVVAAVECLFGTWMIFGVSPRLTRCLAIGVFLGLFHIVLIKLSERSATCGCYGRLQISPWVALTIDAVAVVALLAARPRAMESAAGQPTEARRLWLFGVVGVTVAVIGAVLTWRSSQVDNGGDQPPSSPVAQSLVLRAADAIQGNYEPMPPVRLETTITYQNAEWLVQKVAARAVQVGGPKQTLPPTQLLYRNDFLLYRDAVRRDTEPVRSQPKHVVIQIGTESFQYLPTKKQGWARGSPFVEVYPLDPRCFGLDKPVRDVPTWLRGLRVTETEEVGGGLRVAGLDSAGQPVASAGCDS